MKSCMPIFSEIIQKRCSVAENSCFEIRSIGSRSSLSSARLDDIEKLVFHVQIFEVVKTAFWQGHVFVGRTMLRTSAGTRALDATSRKDFFADIAPNQVQLLYSTISMRKIDFKIKKSCLRWVGCCRSISPVSVLLYKLTLYEPSARILDNFLDYPLSGKIY